MQVVVDSCNPRVSIYKERTKLGGKDPQLALLCFAGGEWRSRTPCALRGNWEAALVLSCVEPLKKGSIEEPHSCHVLIED